MYKQKNKINIITNKYCVFLKKKVIKFEFGFCVLKINKPLLTRSPALSTL